MKLSTQERLDVYAEELRAGLLGLFEGSRHVWGDEIARHLPCAIYRGEMRQHQDSIRVAKEIAKMGHRSDQVDAAALDRTVESIRTIPLATYQKMERIDGLVRAHTSRFAEAVGKWTRIPLRHNFDWWCHQSGLPIHVRRSNKERSRELLEELLSERVTYNSLRSMPRRVRDIEREYLYDVPTDEYMDRPRYEGGGPHGK